MDTNIEEQENNLTQEQTAEVTGTNKVEGATEVKGQDNNLPQEQATEATETNKVEGVTEVNEQEDNLPQEQAAETKEEEKTEKVLSWKDLLYTDTNSFRPDRQEKVPFSSALEAGDVGGTEEDGELLAVIGLEQTKVGGGVKFQPNKDLNRPVVIYEYPLPGKILKMRRNGSKDTEGVTITDLAFHAAFDKSVGALKHREQINLMLTDNTLIVGYVVKPKNGSSKVYIPIHVWPEKIAPPTSGFIQSVRVKKVIIG